MCLQPLNLNAAAFVGRASDSQGPGQRCGTIPSCGGGPCAVQYGVNKLGDRCFVEINRGRGYFGHLSSHAKKNLPDRRFTQDSATENGTVGSVDFQSCFVMSEGLPFVHIGDQPRPKTNNRLRLVLDTIFSNKQLAFIAMTSTGSSSRTKRKTSASWTVRS